MGKLFKNLKPYWKSVILIVLLLVVQAFCDLSLPQYTSEIIDVGIQNSGVSHILPEKMTAQEYEIAQVFMTETEKQQWQNAYVGSGEDYYQRKDAYDKLTEDELDQLDSDLFVPVMLNYQMSMVDEKSFREIVTQQSDPEAAEQLAQASIAEIGASMGVELEPYVRQEEDEDGNLIEVTRVDVRPLFAAMTESGQMDDAAWADIRKQMNEMLDTMGDSLAHSSGVAYAIQCDEAAGLDTEKIQSHYLWVSGGKMVLMALLMMAAAISVSFVASRVGAGVGRDLRERVFSRVVQFSGAEMDRFSTASLITRSTNDIQQVQMVTILFLRMLLYAPIIGIGGIIKVANTGAGMGWVIALAVIVILAVVGILMMIAMPKFQKMQTLVDRVNLVSREILTGLPVIRAFGREKKEEQRFEDANQALTKTMLFTNRVMTFMMPLMMMLMYGLSILIVWIGAHRIDGGVMQVGSMTAFITYSMMIVMAFLMITMMSVMLPRASVAAGRIDEVICTESSVKEADQPKALAQCHGTLQFDHVNFRYPGAEEDALHDISFTAEPGKTTAIIGSTGCGKSTLVNLIPRLYDVTGGSLTLDGVDVRELSLEQLRQQIGFVPQKGVLFSGTIASNLRFGNREATEEELQKAAEIAQALDFITEKPDGFDSSIAQGGTNVSGGQKQRLTIARAIAKNPSVYVFDDSFSALDLKTDAKLRAALGEYVQNSTILLVAQRISTILHADQILVLEEGNIVGKGTHEELLQSCEVYRQIARSQLSASELGLEEESASEKGVTADGE